MQTSTIFLRIYFGVQLINSWGWKGKSALSSKNALPHHILPTTCPPPPQPPIFGLWDFLCLRPHRRLNLQPPQSLLKILELIYSSIATCLSFFPVPPVVFVSFRKYKIEESWSVGSVPIFSVLHNVDLEKPSNPVKKRTLLFFGQEPIKGKGMILN